MSLCLGRSPVVSTSTTAMMWPLLWRKFLATGTSEVNVREQLPEPVGLALVHPRRGCPGLLGRAELRQEERLRLREDGRRDLGRRHDRERGMVEVEADAHPLRALPDEVHL